MTGTVAADSHNGQAASGTQRLDKWLWFARLTKSRTVAASCISAGKIRVNSTKVEKPAQAVKVGDVITSRIQKTVRVLRIAALGARRGPAPEAQSLYEDLTPRAPAPAPGEKSETSVFWGEREPGAGRPTKRERRQLDQLKGRA
ncbi:MAG: RNA-binding S4 domain-containing protein [Hyphomicrobium sp.]|jgi:ribosome-associated heat shock protein Hsp15